VEPRRQRDVPYWLDRQQPQRLIVEARLRAVPLSTCAILDQASLERASARRASLTIREESRPKGSAQAVRSTEQRRDQLIGLPLDSSYPHATDGRDRDSSIVEMKKSINGRLL
ncbi:hypothetical protein ACVBEG_27365, partial [Pseudomonas sp. GG8]